MASAGSGPLSLGRYLLHRKIASGGMATVYLGRLLGPVGFGRVVAIKRMHAAFATDPELVERFREEAAMTARVQHPNVVATLDVIAEQDELFLVMEHVRGQSLSALLEIAAERQAQVPVPIAVAIACGMLDGLHAAHEAKDEAGRPLGIVHRDVSPQNVLVGADGLVRIADFGIAKATERSVDETEDGQVRGKIRYLAPEQLAIGVARIDRRVDVFSAGSVLWETLSGRPLFENDDPAQVITKLLAGDVEPLRRFRTDVSPQLEAVVRRALRRDADERPSSARELVTALEAATPRIASARAVGEWVQSLAAALIATRDAWIVELESATDGAHFGDDGDEPEPDRVRERVTAPLTARVAQLVIAAAGPAPDDPTRTLDRLPVPESLDEPTIDEPTPPPDAPAEASRDSPEEARVKLVAPAPMRRETRRMPWLLAGSAGVAVVAAFAITRAPATAPTPTSPPASAASMPMSASTAAVSAPASVAVPQPSVSEPAVTPATPFPVVSSPPPRSKPRPRPSPSAAPKAPDPLGKPYVADRP